MGELERRRRTGTPATRNSTAVSRAAETAIAQVHYRAFKVYKEATGRMTAETKAIQDEQHFRLVAPMVHETSKQLGGQLLMAAEDASSRIRGVVRDNYWS